MSILYIALIKFASETLYIIYLMYCFDNKFITLLHTLAIIPNLIYNVPTVTANQTSGQKMSRDQPRPKSRIRFITMNCSELL